MPIHAGRSHHTAARAASTIRLKASLPSAAPLRSFARRRAWPRTGARPGTSCSSDGAARRRCMDGSFHSQTRLASRAFTVELRSRRPPLRRSNGGAHCAVRGMQRALFKAVPSGLHTPHFARLMEPAVARPPPSGGPCENGPDAAEAVATVPAEAIAIRRANYHRSLCRCPTPWFRCLNGLFPSLLLDGSRHGRADVPPV
eukprot:365542-Chlamydomonas_euryale.AAC.36